MEDPPVVFLDGERIPSPSETLGDLLRKKLDETESVKERFQRLGRQHGLACCCDACMKAIKDYNDQRRQGK